MAQTSGIGQEESWGWPCPYCRAHNPMEAAACANCGSQLRDPEDDDLFTTVAADNAEVIPPDAPFARENMWTTDANGAEDDVDDGEVVDDELWDRQPVAGSRTANGSAFSSEPAARPSDVIDEPFHVEEPINGTPRATGNLFSNNTGAGRAGDGPGGEGGRSPFGVPINPDAPGFGAGPGAGPAAAHAHAPGPAHAHAPEPDPWMTRDQWGAAPSGWAPGTPPAGAYGRPAPASMAQGPFAAPQPGPPPGYDQPPAGLGHWQYNAPPAPPTANGHAEQHHAPVPDPHGLSAAVGRLRPDDQERAAVPISVCGALLQHDEVVLAAVTGQMLGHAAVVVLTTRRVLVVNARRWQPIVDVFDVGPTLTVRGRHDRDVAALTFSDETRLSTVDGIGEVGLAVELAERIRGE